MSPPVRRSSTHATLAVLVLAAWNLPGWRSLSDRRGGGDQKRWKKGCLKRYRPSATMVPATWLQGVQENNWLQDVQENNCQSIGESAKIDIVAHLYI